MSIVNSVSSIDSTLFDASETGQWAAVAQGCTNEGGPLNYLEFERGGLDIEPPQFCSDQDLEESITSDPSSAHVGNGDSHIDSREARKSQPDKPILDPGRAPAKRFRPSDSAKRVLEAHFRIKPYPDKPELDSIAEKASMTVQQVRNWFGNRRKRMRVEGRTAYCGFA